MKGIVTFFDDQVGWLHAYNEDAIVISNIVGYKKYDRFNGMLAIGFPRQCLRKVAYALAYYNIGYSIDGIGVLKEYPNSKYNECLDINYVNKHHVFDEIADYITKIVITGEFTIQYNDEEPITMKIGVDINPEAKIVEFVANNEIGESHQFGEDEDIVKIINKNLEIKRINILLSEINA